MPPNGNATDLREALHQEHCETANWRLRYEGALNTARTLRAENQQLHADLQAARQLLTEIADIAICESEGVAQKLRRIVGYPDGPYPPIEPA